MSFGAEGFSSNVLRADKESALFYRAFFITEEVRWPKSLRARMKELSLYCVDLSARFLRQKFSLICGSIATLKPPSKNGNVKNLPSINNGRDDLAIELWS
ncbi:hypothetical protein DO97_06585 [Neosynechococcus sphagnicola sy1]|uniref:Uncharacterized protein n=1 Tax=Neosynechococcus sphagnicola sy1 TaxID=1497020 RepID=A0A098TLD4_9CYAN|nr:hypothetical protein DO97_06585 [Neosynechococcus sphagnicola sy1]